MAVVLEAYVNGVSTRKVDRLVEQLGIDGMTKDRVSARVPGAGRAGRAVPPAAAGGRLPVPVARRQGAPRGAVGSCGVRDPTAGLSRQPGEAEGSLTPELRGRAGSSPDNDATRQDCRMAWARLARRTVCDASEPVIEPPQASPLGSNPMDMGRASGAREPLLCGETGSRRRISSSGGVWRVSA